MPVGGGHAARTASIPCALTGMRACSDCIPELNSLPCMGIKAARGGNGMQRPPPAVAESGREEKAPPRNDGARMRRRSSGVERAELRGATRWPSTNRRAAGGVTATQPIRAHDGRGRSCEEAPPPPFKAGQIKIARSACTLEFVLFWDRRGLCTVRSPGVVFWVRRVLRIVLWRVRAWFSGRPGRARVRERVCGWRVFSRQPAPSRLRKLGSSGSCKGSSSAR